MDGQEKAFTVCVCVLMVCISALIGFATYECWEFHRYAIRQGYSEQAIPGVSGVHWVKDGKTLE